MQEGEKATLVVEKVDGKLVLVEFRRGTEA